MKVGSNQNFFQTMNQVQGGGDQAAAATAPAASAPRDAASYAGKQKGALAQAESNQGGSQGNGLLTRLASLGGGTSLPVTKTSVNEPEAFYYNPNEHTPGKTNDIYVHTDGTINSDTEREDLRQAYKNVKEGDAVIFVVESGEKKGLYKLEQKELDGQDAAGIPKVASLKKDSEEVFTLHHLEDDVEPLEDMEPKDLNVLKGLTATEHRVLDAVGDQGAILLNALSSPGVVAALDKMNPNMLPALSRLNFDDISDKTKADPFRQCGHDDYEALKLLNSNGGLQLLQNLSEKEFKALQALSQLPRAAQEVVHFDTETLNVLGNLDLEQFNQLQSIEPGQLQQLRSISERQNGN